MENLDAGCSFIMSLGGGNFIELKKGGIFSKCNIRISGCNNNVSCLGQIHHSKIVIRGNNNMIYFGIGVKANAFNILIKGEGCKIFIDKNVTSNGTNLCCVGTNNSIYIGKDCMLSSQIEIWNSDTHCIIDANSLQPINDNKPVHIGKHVWIGQHATILKGVTIGDGAIVGMNSVVTKDIPGNCSCAGNPAVVKKQGITWDRRQKIDC